MANSDLITTLPALSHNAGLDEIRRWLNDFQASYNARDPNAAGDPEVKYLTVQKAIDYGILSRPGSGGGGLIYVPPGVTDPDPTDTTPPDPITGLTATGGVAVIIVEFDPPTYLQGAGNAYTEIWGAVRPPSGPPPTFANAKRIYTCADSTSFAAIPVDPGVTMHFWAGAVTRAGIRQIDTGGPSGGLNGVSATSAQDVTTLLDALTAAAQNPAAPYSKFAVRADLFYVGNDDGSFDGLPFFVTTVPITQNGVTAPAGVYMRSAFIANGTITNAMIGNAVITDAKIATLSAGKITSGAIDVGSTIQSSNYVPGSAGWLINGVGDAEFYNALVRGTVYATSGEIGGIVITSGSIRSSAFTLGVSGFRFSDDGTGQVGGISITTTSLQSAGFVSGSSGFRLQANGNAQVNQIQVNGGLIQNTAGNTFINLNATGSSPVLRVSTAAGTTMLQIDADGDAFFAGTLTADDVVTSHNVAPQAVTAIYPDFTAAVQDVDAVAYVTVASVNYTATGGVPTIIQPGGFMMAEATATVSGSPVDVKPKYHVRLRRDGITTLFEYQGPQFALPALRDTPSSGSRTYTLEVFVEFPTGGTITSSTAEMTYTSLIVTEHKRS